MKREILFKAKRVDNGEWVFGDLIHLDDRIMIAGKDMSAYDNGNVYCNVELQCVEINPETVYQFTGLFDKNGKKIFEGDILNSEDWASEIFQDVSFEDGSFGVKLYKHAQRDLQGFSRINQEWIVSCTKEIISNIHD